MAYYVLEFYFKWNIVLLYNDIAANIVKQHSNIYVILPIFRVLTANQLSCFRTSTGFSAAELQVREIIETKEMRKVNAAATRITHHGKSMAL